MVSSAKDILYQYEGEYAPGQKRVVLAEAMEELKEMFKTARGVRRSNKHLIASRGSIRKFFKAAIVRHRLSERIFGRCVGSAGNPGAVEQTAETNGVRKSHRQPTSQSDVFRQQESDKQRIYEYNRRKKTSYGHKRIHNTYRADIYSEYRRRPAHASFTMRAPAQTKG